MSNKNGELFCIIAANNLKALKSNFARFATLVKTGFAMNQLL